VSREGEVSRTTLRLPTDLYLRVKALAGRKHRSLNAQLIRIVEYGLAAEEAAQNPLRPRVFGDHTP
jgi:predicted DNA-binding protein